jgi:DNA (cytosine-5)-methyltransferase 1
MRPSRLRWSRRAALVGVLLSVKPLRSLYSGSGVLSPEEVASRVAEIVQRLYFGEARPRSAAQSAVGTRALERIAYRLGLLTESFDEDTLRSLAIHVQRVCKPRPRCGACPLVSFCAIGKKRVQGARGPVVVDLFGGAGGMGYGFRKAGFRVGLAVELDRDAAQSYRFNNPGVPVLEADVETLHAREVRALLGANPTAICAGPPCQAYSLAGSRLEWDPRHHFFRHVLALAKALKPDIVLIENVPGINRRVGGGRNYRRIIEAHLGKHFDVEVYLLRALDYGVPQLRKRYFFIGRDKDYGEIGEPQKTHREKGGPGGKPEAPTVMDALRGLPRRPHGSQREWSKAGDGSIIWNLGTMRHSKRVIRKISRIRGGEGFISYRRLSKRYANTIVAGHRALPVHPTLHRTISVREAACIQGFPRDFVFLGTRANQPLQVANAVPPPLAYAFAKRIRARLRRASK